MKDERVRTLARNLVNYSCELKPGEKILIECIGPEVEMVTALVEEVYKAGGEPYVNLQIPAVTRSILMNASDTVLTNMARYDGMRMEEMDAYIGVRSGDNATELADVPPEKMELYGTLYQKPVHSETRVNNTKWVILRYPTPSMAQMAGTSTEAFEDFYFNVCNLDYGKMSGAMDALVARMNRTDRVHIKGEGTDLRFSIKGFAGIKCAGDRNIPDGEVFTAPVKDSVEGVISYNTPSVHEGFTYENIRFVFEKGKIVEATANDTARINKALDVDPGARYIGEFAIGVNPYVLSPMKDTLFDEKIMGSIHFTPGQAYHDEGAYNGNDSAVHWDLVYIQRPEYGGGEIWFDDELIRKDGRFVTEDLLGLNPENLK